MLRRVELVEAYAGQVVSLEDAKAQCRVSHDDEDMLISGLIDAATAHLDGLNGTLGLALGPQTWRAVFDAGDDTSVLPLGPVVSRENPVTADGETAVEFVVGYPNGIPEPIRQAILIHVATLYDERQMSAENWKPTRAYEALLAPWRRWG